MIDPDKVRQFWEQRAGDYGRLQWESVANLEQDEEKLKLKIREETAKVTAWIPPLQGRSVLDLGSGVGQWSLRFCQWGAARVVAVEYIEELGRIASSQAQRQCIDNIEFVTCSVEAFDTDERFDLLFISGLFLYLNDQQLAALIAKLPRLLRPDGVVMLRDSVGTQGRYEIHDRYSEHLGSNYSAIYRTRDFFVDAFAQHGMLLEQDEHVFPEGHPLNKYPETRLHLFLFRGPEALE